MVRSLAAMLACEIVKAREGRACLLNRRVSTLVRGGVRMDLKGAGESRTDPASDKVTGIDLVDDWILNVNPHKLRRRARVLSPSEFERSGR